MREANSVARATSARFLRLALAEGAYSKIQVHGDSEGNLPCVGSGERVRPDFKNRTEGRNSTERASHRFFPYSCLDYRFGLVRMRAYVARSTLPPLRTSPTRRPRI